LLYDGAVISSIKGEILYTGGDFLEVLCGNTGYRVHCPARIIGACSVGEIAELFTHLHVREDAHTLYGFQTRKERDFFETLLRVSGIGPKTALSVLSAAPLETIQRAIASGDPSLLPRVSGIGPKIAQRIVMELKDKMEDFASDDGGALRESGDVIDALVGLGYSRYQAQQVLQTIPASIEGVENKVKEALKILGK